MAVYSTARSWTRDGAEPLRRSCRFRDSEARVERGEDDEREEGSREQTPDHNSGERLLDLGARAGRERHRHETERGDERGHCIGAEARQRAFSDGALRVYAVSDQLANLRQHDEAVQHGDARQRDEADGG